MVQLNQHGPTRWTQGYSLQHTLSFLWQGLVTCQTQALVQQIREQPPRDQRQKRVGRRVSPWPASATPSPVLFQAGAGPGGMRLKTQVQGLPAQGESLYKCTGPRGETSTW